MIIYRFAWVGLTAVVVATASVYDVAAGGLARMAVLGVGFALVSAMLAFVIAEGRPDRWLWVRRCVLWSAVGSVAADALNATWGTPGTLAGLAILLTSPPLLAQARACYLSWASRRTCGPPEALRTRDLRRRWDWSTAEVLRTSTSPQRRLILVQERSQLLDELQRRDPEHFDAWLVFAVPDRDPAHERPRGR